MRKQLINLILLFILLHVNLSTLLAQEQMKEQITNILKSGNLTVEKATEALQLSRTLGDSTLVREALTERAILAYNQREYNDFNADIAQVVSICKDSDDQECLAECNNRLARYYLKKDAPAKADSLHNEALKTFIRLNNKKQISNTYKYKSAVAKARLEYSAEDSLMQLAIQNMADAQEYGLLAGLYNRQMYTHYRRNEIDEGTVYAEKAAALLPKIDNPKKIAAVMGDLGSWDMLTGKYTEAAEKMRKATIIYDSLEDLRSLGIISGNLSLIYKKTNDYENAELFALKALASAKKRKSSSLPLDYYRVASILISADSLDFDRQLAYVDSSAMNIESKSDISSWNRVYNSYVVIYKNKGDYPKAIENAKNAIAIFKDEKDPRLREIYYIKGKVEYLQKNYQAAVKSLEIALDMSKEKRANVHMLDWLAKAYQGVGKYDLAYQNLRDASIIKDSLHTVSEESKFKEYEEKYEADKKELENENLKIVQAEKDKTINLQRASLVAGSILLGLLGLILFFFNKQRRELKRLNSSLTTQRDQIKVLNRELNHRVKNNLTFMTSLLEMQGRRTEHEETKQVLKESENRLKALSIVHQNLFQNNSNTTINLKEYLQEIVAHLQSIFEIPGKTLTIQNQLADVLFDAEDAMRIGLIVNELVTNSVKHAFENVENPNIRLTTTQHKDGKINLSYTDNGPGVIRKTLVEPIDSRSSNGIGTKLIQLLQRQLASKVELSFES